MAEQVDADGIEDDEPAEDGDLEAEEGEAPTLEEVLQTEVEQLADEIAQAEEEGIDPAHLEALESGIEASADALVSMREARTLRSWRTRSYRACWPGDSTQERWPQGRGRQGGGRVGSTQGCSKPSWAERWLPDTQGGPGQACGTSARDRGRQGHHTHAQKEAQAYDRRPVVADAKGRATDFEQAIVDYVNNIPGAFAELTPDVLHCRPAGFFDGSCLKPCRECCHATATCAADGQPTGSHGPTIPRHVRATPPARNGHATTEPGRHDGGAAGRTAGTDVSDTAGHLGDHAGASTSPRSSTGSPGLPRLKRGQKQLITQAWERHRRDQLLVSCTPGRLREVMTAEFFASYAKGMQDVFVVEVPTICAEIYSDAEPVTRVARQRGHTTGPTLTLDTGWDFRRRDHRLRALQQVRDTKPYFLVLAFPCGPWSQLQNLATPPDQALPLVRFAAQLAREQSKAGRHFVLENPLGSATWKLPSLRALRATCFEITVDMCRFNLRGPSGLRRRKPTRLVTSSQAVVSKFLGMRCTGKHKHEPVMGGSRVTTAAWHYTKEFSRALVEAFEDQFNFESAALSKEFSVNECYEIVGSTGAVDFHHDVLTGDFAEADDFAPDGDAADSEEDDLGDPFVW